MNFKLTDHYFAHLGHLLPAVDQSQLLDYVVGSNGTFARGLRPGLEVCMPVSFNLQPIRALAPVKSYVRWDYPQVPKALVEVMLARSKAVCEQGPREALFHLSFSAELSSCAEHLACDSGWHVEFPAQHPLPGRETDSIMPDETGAGTSTERALIELHSHHNMRAEFSPDDNTDESQGFRVYAVIGTIFERAMIRARVGLFGHFYEHTASEFFELPDELHDCVGGFK